MIVLQGTSKILCMSMRDTYFYFKIWKTNWTISMTDCMTDIMMKIVGHVLDTCCSLQPNHNGIIDVNFSPRKLVEKKAEFVR